MEILGREYQERSREAIIGKLTKYSQQSKNEFERKKRKREEEEQQINETGQSNNCGNLRLKKKIQGESGNSKGRKSLKVPKKTTEHRKQRK